MVAVGHMVRHHFMPHTMPRIAAVFPYRGTATTACWYPRSGMGHLLRHWVDHSAATAADRDEVLASEQGEGPMRGRGVHVVAGTLGGAGSGSWRMRMRLARWSVEWLGIRFGSGTMSTPVALVAMALHGELRSVSSGERSYAMW
jgi:hypothetical protein